jgi:hypothetical protein
LRAESVHQTYGNVRKRHVDGSGRIRHVELVVKVGAVAREDAAKFHAQRADATHIQDAVNVQHAGTPIAGSQEAGAHGDRAFYVEIKINRAGRRYVAITPACRTIKAPFPFAKSPAARLTNISSAKSFFIPTVFYR